MDGTYQFIIEGSYSPGTLPMDRLAEYVAALAKLLGDRANVHFHALRPGSTVLLVAVDEPARPKVRERTERVRDGTGAHDATEAFTALDILLRGDNATGRLVGDAGKVIVPFPGKNRPAEIVFGPIRQDGTLDGQLIRIGGRDDTIPVLLRDGDVLHAGLFTTAEVAKRLAAHYLGPSLRVHGSGTWLRGADGGWTVKTFKVADFEVLDETALPEVVDKLRKVSGSDWKTVGDPVAALMTERGGADR